MDKPKTGWLDYVQSTHRAVQVIAQYLKDGPQPSISGRNLTRARRLLGVHGAGGKWSVDRRNAGERLQLAGIDPERLEVADEVRFAHAMDYMRATETFKVEGFKRWLEEHDEPSAVPARDVPARPHPLARKRKENAVNEQINRRINEIRA